MATRNGYKGYKTPYEGEISRLRNKIEGLKKDNEQQAQRVSRVIILAEFKEMELRSMKLDLKRLQQENLTLKALIQRWGELEELGGSVTEEESAPRSTGFSSADSWIDGGFDDTEKHRDGDGDKLCCAHLDKLNQIKSDIPEGLLTPAASPLELGISQDNGGIAGFQCIIPNPGNDDAPPKDSSKSNGTQLEAQDGKNLHLADNLLVTTASQTPTLPGAEAEGSTQVPKAGLVSYENDSRATPTNNPDPKKSSSFTCVAGGESGKCGSDIVEISRSSLVLESGTESKAGSNDRWETLMQELEMDFPGLNADRNRNCSEEQERTGTTDEGRNQLAIHSSDSLSNGLPPVSKDSSCPDSPIEPLLCPEKPKPVLRDPWVRQKQEELLKSFKESFKVKAEFPKAVGSETGSSGGQPCKIKTQEPALPGRSGAPDSPPSPKVKLEGVCGPYDFESTQSVYQPAGYANEDPATETEHKIQSNDPDLVILKMPHPKVKRESKPIVEDLQLSKFAGFPGVREPVAVPEKELPNAFMVKESGTIEETTDGMDFKMGVSMNPGSPPFTFVQPMGSSGSLETLHSEARALPSSHLGAEGSQGTQIVREICISEEKLSSKVPNGLLVDIGMPNDTRPPVTGQKPPSMLPRTACPEIVPPSMNMMRACQNPLPARPVQAPPASPRAAYGLPYNYEKIREVVIRRLPKDISYQGLLSGVRGGPLEAAVINWTSLEARLIFMEPEAARACYQHLKKEGLWVPTKEPHSRVIGNDRFVHCDLGGFLWTANSAKPRPSLVSCVWELGKTRVMAVTNLPSTFTIEKAKKDVLQLLSQPGGERVVFESVGQLVDPISRPGEAAVSVMFKFSAISYALQVERMLESLPEYKDALCIYFPDTCGKLVNKEPPSTWIGSPELHRKSSEGSLQPRDIKAGNEDLLDKVDPNPTDQGLLSPMTLPKTLDHKADPGAKNGGSQEHSSWDDYTPEGSSPRPVGAHLNWRAPHLAREYEKSLKATDSGKDGAENGFHIEPEGNFLQRCVCLTNLPPSLDYPVLFRYIAGGAVEHTQIFLPKGDEKTSKAFVVFLGTRAAKKYKDFILKNNVTISNSRRIGVTDDIPGYMYDQLRVVSPKAIAASRLSRCLWIHGLHPTVAISDVKGDLEVAMNHHELKWETATTYTIPGKPNKVNTVIRFPTILSAMWAKGVLDRHGKYRGCLTRYVADPCARPLTEMGAVSAGLRF